MEEAEATPANDAPESAPTPAPPDWSDVRGFQVIATAGGDPPADSQTRAEELGKELATRAARFAQSIDESIVLASDGVIRWLGDPVARLVGGDDVLKPRAVLLADEGLVGESREAVETRLALWVAAHVRKVLGPLEALAEPGAVADSVRELAQRIVQSLGVLDRERVRQQVKNLDQSARSALRKLGVRFGATYIYVPALLKPGARTLCSQLWSLRRGAEPGAERLLAFAASGRTSFAAEAPLSPDTYRVAGFRLCGERVVRVDIVERLTDLIRAAIPDHMRPSGRAPSEAYGFLVTPQMTSLTGCAGEAFASILRSLGFEAHKVKKIDFEAATRKAPTEPIIAAVAAPEAEAVADDTGVAPTAEGDIVADASDAPDVAMAAEEPISAEESAASARDPETTTDMSTSSERPDIVDEAEPVAIAEPERAPAEEAVAFESDESEEEAPAEALSSESVDASESSETGPASEATSEVAAGGLGESEASVAAPAEEEWIEIWRPAPRRPRPPARSSAPAEADAAERPPRHHRDQRRPFGRDRDARPPAHAAASVAAPATAEAPVATARHGLAESRRGSTSASVQRSENRRGAGIRGTARRSRRAAEEGAAPSGRRHGLAVR
jgi:ATP-dependent RNA helicase SUPV3L1/SUV3